MSQLALPVTLPDGLSFDSYYPGANRDASGHMARLAAGSAGASPVWLWGASGSGKSHLLQAACAGASAAGDRVAYLPLAALAGFGAGVFAGLDEAGLVCVDDLQAVAGREDWELAVFGLWNALNDNGGRLAVASLSSPAELPVRLADLRSRLAAGAVYRLAPLDETQLPAALALRAHRRGLALPDDTARWLLRRLPRDPATLFRLLDRLDTASLAAQRRLTVPFVRQALSELVDGG